MNYAEKQQALKRELVKVGNIADTGIGNREISFLNRGED